MTTSTNHSDWEDAQTRRRSQRFPLEMATILTPHESDDSLDTFIAAQTRDISANGVFVALYFGPRVGARVNIEMKTVIESPSTKRPKVPSWLKINAVGRVVRRTTEGIAIDFETKPSLQRLGDAVTA